MKNRSKAIAPVIIAVILIVAIVAAGVVVYFVVYAPKPGPGPGPGPGAGFQISEIENYGDLVNYHVTHMIYQFTSYEASTDTTSTGTITFDDLGDDMVDGDLCRKLSMVITSNGDTYTITGWVLKSDWSTFKKIESDGNPVPEEYLQTYGAMIGTLVFLPYVTFFAWNIAWASVPSEWGTLQNIGSESQWYGATYIPYNKWLFTPNPAYAPLEDLESIEIWQGQADSYYLFTYFKATNDDGDWFEFELLELTM